jgi:hypothetical protein
MVLRKLARIGLWYYELCVPLPYGGVYMLHSRLALGESPLPIHEVVRWWCKVIHRKGGGEGSIDENELIGQGAPHDCKLIMRWGTVHHLQ